MCECYPMEALGSSSPGGTAATPRTREESESSTLKNERPQILGSRGFMRKSGCSTPIELFLEGVRVWEPVIRSLLNDNAALRESTACERTRA